MRSRATCDYWKNECLQFDKQDAREYSEIKIGQLPCPLISWFILKDKLLFRICKCPSSRYWSNNLMTNY